MLNPPVIQLSERRAAAAPAMPKPQANDRRSKVIRLCVQYCQMIGAMDAGYAADPSGDCSFATAGNHLRRATRLLPKLVALSPHMVTGAEPLSADELKAKAAVAQALYGFRSGEEPEPGELLFLKFFAGEVAAHLEAQATQAAEARRAALTA
jgi:hypothetical protein